MVNLILSNESKCPWCLGFEQYIHYHDTEWGVPVYDDRHLFEFLVLESAQAGLSWATILKKREGYRQAFSSFDYQKIANYSSNEIEALLLNPNIIRNQLKIIATINNANRFLEIQSKFGSFSSFIWNYVDGVPKQNQWATMAQLPASTKLSDQISKDLKKAGFKFLGSTTVYAYMQAMGLVNDHLITCQRHQELGG
jgi:DNA-3-methyladenine glycosylase I